MTQTIIPAVMQTLDLVIYPVGEGVIYDMMHRRHHHRRETNRNKKNQRAKEKRVQKGNIETHEN